MGAKPGKDVKTVFGRGQKTRVYREGGRILLIPTEAILPNPEQPRRDFDPEALKELARSIEENGILNPLSITFREGKPMLVAGERRWRAAKLAGLGELPCVEVSAADAAHGAVLTLIENMQRVDMNCFEEAEGIGRLIREYGLTQEEAALRLGYTQPTIANKLRILRLPESVRRRLAAAGLTERHARALLRLTETDKLEWVLDRILRDRLNVAQTERLVEDTLKGDPPRKRPLLIVRDVRLFVNTVHHAVDTMRRAGIAATLERRETGRDVEYVVHIPADCFDTPKSRSGRDVG
ncbi:MAG: ParB/RepB/Spo0J family partition protein [Clostridia bacterium]|nr:ParB/RepB/Spo0J family partition protein [Clostridia bacterium]